jgi:hypothetical protein
LELLVGIRAAVQRSPCNRGTGAVPMSHTGCLTPPGRLQAEFGFNYAG